MKPFAYKTKLAVARRRLRALIDFESLVKERGSSYGVFPQIYRKHKISSSSLWYYRQRVIGLNKEDWLWALFPGWARTGTAKLEIPVAAFDILLASYLDSSNASAAQSYRLLKRLAPSRGWCLPSYKTFLSRLKEAGILRLRI